MNALFKTMHSRLAVVDYCQLPPSARNLTVVADDDDRRCEISDSLTIPAGCSVERRCRNGVFVNGTVVENSRATVECVSHMNLNHEDILSAKCECTWFTSFVGV